jgi:hypothetical protein
MTASPEPKGTNQQGPGRLERWGKAAWLPILLVSSASLCVGLANYWLQSKANEPSLASNGGRLDEARTPATLRVDWIDVGKRPARRGHAVLFTVDEQKNFRAREKMSEASIIGPGTSVFPNYVGSAEFKGVDMTRFKGRFLVCATYFDEASAVYNQAFVFRPGEGLIGEIPLLEEAPPGYDICR